MKAFLKKAGLANRNNSPKKGGAKGAALSIDGDRMDPNMQIADADLEDGDMVDVVGL